MMETKKRKWRSKRGKRGLKRKRRKRILTAPKKKCTTIINQIRGVGYVKYPGRSKNQLPERSPTVPG